MGITTVVDNLVLVSRETLASAKDPRRQEKGEEILQQLIDSNNRLVTLGNQVQTDQMPSKQKLAAAAYEVAKNTKELVSLFDMDY